MHTSPCGHAVAQASSDVRLNEHTGRAASSHPDESLKKTSAGLGFRACRKHEPERAAAADLALELDAAAVRLDGPLASEAPGPSPRARASGPCPRGRSARRPGSRCSSAMPGPWSATSIQHAPGVAPAATRIASRSGGLYLIALSTRLISGLAQHQPVAPHRRPAPAASTSSVCPFSSARTPGAPPRPAPGRRGRRAPAPAAAWPASARDRVSSVVHEPRQPVDLLEHAADDLAIAARRRGRSAARPRRRSAGR